MTENPGDYPPNSKISRPRATRREEDDKNPEERRKPVQKVVSGEVVRRKPSMNRRIGSMFSGGEARGVGGYVFLEVLLPALRDMITDAGHAAIERAMGGEVRPGSARRYRGGYTNYNAPYSGGRTPPAYPRADPRASDRGGPSRRSRTLHDFDDIELQTRVEAEEVLQQLDALIFEYQAARVSDLYDLVGIDASYTDDRYGWTDLHLARATRTRNGNYLLDLPKPEVLD